MNTIEQVKEKFDIVMGARMAIIANGTKMDFSDPQNILKLIPMAYEITRGRERYDFEADPIDQDWELYAIDPDSDCPIHRLGMPSWLVYGAAAALPDGEDGGKFTAWVKDQDPTVWLTGIEDTLNALPPHLATPGIRTLLAILVDKQNKTPEEDMNEVREAIKAKHKAMTEGYVCGSEGRRLDVVIVGL